jgi:hypothetical protein
MKGLRLATIFFLILLVLSTLESRGADFMPVKELRAGMKGYAKSVFQGTRIETFPVTVLGVVRKRLGEADMIIVRLDGGYCAEHRCGIIAGMSGSPVYVGGRLIGAISYGWAFSLEPIAGVTPIENMLKDASGSGPVLSGGGERQLASPLVVGGKRYTRVRFLASCSAVRGGGNDDTMVMSPVSSHFTVSGFGERGFRSLKSALARYGAVSVEGASEGDLPVSRPGLLPGAALGVQLLKGDLSVSVTGTLTWRDGDRVLAFGHPMLQMGNVGLPLVSAYIHNILPSSLTSFKMSSPLEVVGTMNRDRLYGISGRLHQSPPMIPVTLSINDRSLNTRRKYHLMAASHPVLTRLLVEGALMDAVASTSAFSGNTTAGISYRLETDCFPPLVGRDLLVSSEMDQALAFRVGEMLDSLTDNPFQPVKFSRLYVSAEIEQKKNVAVLEKVIIPGGKFIAGETVPVQIWIKPFGRDPVRREITFTVPGNMKKGEIRIGVCGGSGAEQMKKKLFISQIPPGNIRQLIKQIRDREKANQVVCRVVFPSEGAVLRRELFSFLPRSVSSILSSSSSSEVESERDYRTFLVDTPWYVTGEAQVTLRIDQAPEDVKAPEKPPAAKSYGRWPVEFMFRRVSSPDESTPAVKGKKEKTDSGERAGQAVPPGTKSWDMDGIDLFEGGLSDGISCSSRGEFSLAPALKRLAASHEQFIWSLAFDAGRGRIYAGTGPGGKIMRLTRGGELISEIETGEVLVSALAVDEEGNLFAGTSPGGKVFRVTPEGKCTLAWDSDSAYIWDLKSWRGGLIAATGGPGGLFRLDGKGRALPLFKPEEEHITSIATGGDGEIFAGTASSGTVYKILPDGDARPLFTCSDESVDSLALSKSGELYAASGDRIYMLLRDGRLKTIDFDGKQVFRLIFSGDETLYAASGRGGRIYKVFPGGEYTTVYYFKGAQTLSLVSGAAGEILFSTGGNTALYGMGDTSRVQGSLTTEVFDCALQARWGKLRWFPVLFPGTTVAVQSRSGNTPFPDGTWSPWSEEYLISSGSRLSSPPGRFIQCRFILKGSGGVSPVLSGSSLFYGEESRPPLMSWKSPSGAERWSGKKKLSLEFSAHERSAYAFDVYISGEDQKSWKELIRDAAVTWEEKTDPRGFSSGEFELKTGGQPDGKYFLKLKARNRMNGEDPFLKAECVAGPVVFCNTEPEVNVISQKRIGDSVEIKVQAKSPLINITGVSYQVGEENWREACPEDGICDSPVKNFILGIDGFQSRKMEVRIKATDEAGNSRILKRSLER